MKRTRLTKALALLLAALLLLLSGCGAKDKNDEKKPSATDAQGNVIASETSAPETTTSPAEKYTAEEKEKMICFTFDDGPNTATTERILDALEPYGYTATFFVIGERIADSNVPSMKRAVEMGCEIGNHTWTHNLRLNSLSVSDRDSELNRVDEAVKEKVGVTPTLMRAPGGSFSNIKNNIDYPILYWSIDTEDWKKKGNAGNADAARSLADYILDNIYPGCIVLMHDIYEFTAETVELVMPELHERGYKVMSVSDLAAAYGVELQPGTVYFDIQQPVILEKGEYIVATQESPLCLRVEAEDGAEVLARIPKGTQITVTETLDGWAKTSFDGATGWVSAKYLEKTSAAPTSAQQTSQSTYEY